MDGENVGRIGKEYTGYLTRYRTRHFFNNFTTNEDIAKNFEADLPQCVRNVKEKNVLLFKFCCNIFIGVRIIKEMPGSVASGTPCIIQQYPINEIILSACFHTQRKFCLKPHNASFETLRPSGNS